MLLYLPSNLRGHSRLDQEYVVLELLGQGGFGHVFKVKCLWHPRWLVVKKDYLIKGIVIKVFE